MAATSANGPNALLQPRVRHAGPCFADGAAVSLLSQSASEQYVFFQLPDPCFVIRGHIKGSQQAGVSGQAIIKLGTSKGDSTFGTFTISGGAALAATPFYGPNTLSGSGGAFSASNPQFWPVTATVTSGATATTSLSLYVMIEYVMPGNLGSGGQGL